MNSTKNKIRVVFWGSSEFALPALEILVNQGDYQIVAVITNPDKPAGRGRGLSSTPVKFWAFKPGFVILEPDKLDHAFLDIISKTRPDIYIVAAYGKIIPKEILALPKFGALNIHPSLLPRWRGPSPIQFAILNGDPETGVTIIKMDEKMDHGPILAKRELEFPISNFQFPKLLKELAILGANLLIDTLPKFLAGEVTLVPQDDSQAIYSKILKKTDGRIDWAKSAEEITRMVRALNPWPGAWTTWPAKKAYRVRIEEATTTSLETSKGTVGFVWQSADFPFLVKTGAGSLVVEKLTLEGKPSQNAKVFLRGYPRMLGSVLL